MSWEMFRCDIDCNVEPEHCINADLYKSMTDALVSGYVCTFSSEPKHKQTHTNVSLAHAEASWLLATTESTWTTAGCA